MADAPEAVLCECIGRTKDDFCTFNAVDSGDFRDFGLITNSKRDFGGTDVENLQVVPFRGLPVCFCRENMRFLVFDVGTIASVVIWLGANQLDTSDGMSELTSLAIMGAIGTLGMLFASILYTVFIQVALK